MEHVRFHPLGLRHLAPSMALKAKPMIKSENKEVIKLSKEKLKNYHIRLGLPTCAAAAPMLLQSRSHTAGCGYQPEEDQRVRDELHVEHSKALDKELATEHNQVPRAI